MEREEANRGIEMESEVLNLKQAAQVYGDHPVTFRKKLNAGIIRPPMFRDGNGEKPEYKFPKRSFIEWINSRSTQEINPLSSKVPGKRKAGI
jgi:hypothetical protein